MNNTKRTIWSNDYDHLDNLANEMLKNPEDFGFFDLNDENAFACASEMNDWWLDDEKANLNKELGQSIVMIARLGLWNGKRSAYKIMKGTNLNNIFDDTCGDYVTWYVEDGDIKCDDTHHDGTNHYTYRTIKEGIGEWEFEEMIAEGKDIFELTDKLGHYVNEIYGWEE